MDGRSNSICCHSLTHWIQSLLFFVLQRTKQKLFHGRTLRCTAATANKFIAGCQNENEFATMDKKGRHSIYVQSSPSPNWDRPNILRVRCDAYITWSLFVPVRRPMEFRIVWYRTHVSTQDCVIMQQGILVERHPLCLWQWALATAMA